MKGARPFGSVATATLRLNTVNRFAREGGIIALGKDTVLIGEVQVRRASHGDFVVGPYGQAHLRLNKSQARNLAIGLMAFFTDLTVKKPHVRTPRRNTAVTS